MTANVRVPGAFVCCPSAIVRGVGIGHRTTGGERLAHVFARGRLDADDANPGLELGRHRGAPRDQAAATDADQQQVQRPDLIEQLERDRALPRHHERLVVRVDRHEAASEGEVVEQLVALVRVAVVVDHVRAVAEHGGALRDRRVGGHEDGGRHVVQPRRQGQGLAVVARRDRGHPAHGAALRVGR
jgi:hypothetical protein